jgi:hypothetical protein
VDSLCSVEGRLDLVLELGAGTSRRIRQFSEAALCDVVENTRARLHGIFAPVERVILF